MGFKVVEEFASAVAEFDEAFTGMKIFAVGFEVFG